MADNEDELVDYDEEEVRACMMKCLAEVPMGTDPFSREPILDRPWIST
jgi:hypothetical protein